mmetsp:Transcript_14094/g.37946  ORF Transcript_14094/g.37946 Transcript_14094/m.37946 type:complete len:244 (+) Transcript_14094:370-1101(+)
MRLTKPQGGSQAGANCRRVTRATRRSVSGWRSAMLNSRPSSSARSKPRKRTCRDGRARRHLWQANFTRRVRREMARRVSSHSGPRPRCPGKDLDRWELPRRSAPRRRSRQRPRHSPLVGPETGAHRPHPGPQRWLATLTRPPLSFTAQRPRPPRHRRWPRPLCQRRRARRRVPCALCPPSPLPARAPRPSQAARRQSRPARPLGTQRRLVARGGRQQGQLLPRRLRPWTRRRRTSLPRRPSMA